MKNLKIITIAFLSILIFSCKKENKNEETIKLKEITATIQLPTNSTIDPNNLNVSTVLTDGAPVSNNTAKVTTFDDNAIELAFATNRSGNILLLSYFNPKNTENVTLNTESTAIALIMLHPWTMDLSVEGKEDAISKIKNRSDFLSFKNLVENSINSGNLEPLSTTEIIDSIAIIQKRIFTRITIEKEPLHFDIDNSNITIKNEKSSAAYCVGLYDANNNHITHKLVDGLGKFQATINLVSNNTFFITPIPETVIATPSAIGNYTLIAKSGLSFDNSIENKEALDENLKIFVSNVFGLFSTKLKAILRLKTGACGAEISMFILNQRIMYNSLIAYKSSTKSSYDFTKDFISFSITKFSDIIGIINRCSASYNLKPTSFLNIVKILDVFARAESAYNGSAHLVDWIQYDKEINACFTKNNNNVIECSNPIVGSWKQIGVLWCGIDVWDVPEGQLSQQTSCGRLVGFETCGKDDIMIFKQNMTMEINEGATSCVPANPTDFGTYTINGNMLTTNIQTVIQTSEILQIDSTTLKIDYNNGFIETFQRQ